MKKVICQNICAIIAVAFCIVRGVRKHRTGGGHAAPVEFADSSCRMMDFKVWDYPETYSLGVKITSSPNQSRIGQWFALSRTHTEDGDTVFQGSSPEGFVFCAGDEYVLLKQATSTSEQLHRPDPRCFELTYDLQTCIVPEIYQFQSRLIPTSAGLRASSVVYQLHIPTFTKDLTNTEYGHAGTFESTISKLDYLADLGVTVIELLPINAYPFHWTQGGVKGARNWGYGPASFFSLDSARKGGQASFKRFVDEAMKRGMLVGIDVVINHSGCTHSGRNEATVDGNASNRCPLWHRDFFLGDHPTLWGPRPDFSQPQVIEYFMDFLKYWRESYRIRFFRWDATSTIRKFPYADGSYGPIDPAGVKFLQDANAYLRGPGDTMEDQYTVTVAEDVWGPEWPWPGRTADPAPEGLNFDAFWDANGAFINVEEMQKAQAGDMDMGRLVQQCIAFQNHVIMTENHDLASNQNLGRIPKYLMDKLADQSVTDPYLFLKKSSLLIDLTLTCPGIPMLFQNQEYWSFANFDFELAPFIDDTIDSWKRDGLWNQHSVFQSKVAELIGLRSINKPGTVLRGLLWGTAVLLDSTSYGSWSCPDCKTMVMYRTSSFNATSDTDHVLVIVNFGDITMQSYNIDFRTDSDSRMDDNYIRTALDGTWEVRYNGDAFPHGEDSDKTFGYTNACTDGSFQIVRVENGKTNVCVPRMSTIVLSRNRQ